MTPNHVLAATLRGQAQTQRRLSDEAVSKGAYHDDNDHIDAARLMEQAAERIAILERELEQAAIRFETMHRDATHFTGMALIGGENCRTPLATPNK